MGHIRKHFRGRVDILNAVLLDTHQLSPTSVEVSRWVPGRPANKVPLHLASKVLSAIEGIKTMLGPYGVPLVKEYALKSYSATESCRDSQTRTQEERGVGRNS